MALYFWSRPDYGSNGYPIVIYLPSPKCSFEEALDCIMLAFHHTNIPDLIHIMIQFLKTPGKEYDEFLKSDLYQQFLQSHHENNNPKKSFIVRMFRMIRDGLEIDPEISDYKIVRKLIKWGRDYSKDNLKEFFSFIIKF